MYVNIKRSTDDVSGRNGKKGKKKKKKKKALPLQTYCT